MSDEIRSALISIAFVALYGAGIGLTAGLAAEWDYGWTCREGRAHSYADRFAIGVIWPIGLPAMTAYRTVAGPGENCAARGFPTDNNKAAE